MARQSSSALADAMKLYSHYASLGLASLEDSELIEKIEDISSRFRETCIVIDGLDECGHVSDSSRRCLINAVVELHSAKRDPIRVLEFTEKMPGISTSPTRSAAS